MKNALRIFTLTALLVLLSVPMSAPPAIAESMPASAAEEQTDRDVLHFFDDPLCPVCADQKKFMEEIKGDYPDLEIKYYPINDTESLHELAEERGIGDYRIMAPTTIIGDEILQFNQFEEAEEQALIAAIEGSEYESETTFRVPWLGISLEHESWSLGLLAAVLGSIDGFNVCSLGALILILSIVLALDSRRKIFLYGGLFILTTVMVYGILVFAWGQALDAMVGHLGLLRLIVGLGALAGSVYFFREFWRFYRFGPTCESSSSKWAQKSTNRLLEAFNKESATPLFIAGSIMLFAAVITIIELPCSIGVPLAFSGILVEQGVSTASYIGHIGIYLLFYMLIEIIVFIGAVFTKEIWFAGSKMITWVTFLAAVILLGLAAYYLLSLI